jgi:hypothetical protein
MATFGVAVSIGHHTSPWPNGDQRPAWTWIRTGRLAFVLMLLTLVLRYAGVEATLDAQPEYLRSAGDDDARDLLLDVCAGSTTMVALAEPSTSGRGPHRT